MRMNGGWNVWKVLANFQLGTKICLDAHIVSIPVFAYIQKHVAKTKLF